MGIEGVSRHLVTTRADDRGTFAEVFRRSWAPGETPAVQANLSRSRAGVLRGLHFHRHQWDYWFPLSGSAFVALVDLRDGSPTELVTATLNLSADEPSGLFIPPGVAHGFVAETGFAMVYLVDAHFDGSDEFGVAWDDPELGIGWPASDPILSERDRRNPTLADIRRDRPTFHPSLG